MQRRNLAVIAAAASVMVFGCRAGQSQTNGPVLKVDITADRHAISPYIYGMAYPDPAIAKELRLPLNRWGGDATTRYNWQNNGSNSGDDWFFMGGPTDNNATPGAAADKFIADSISFGGRALLTIPIIDYINGAKTTDCTFPVSIFGPQQKVNPYVHPMVDGKQTDAGNGKTADGKVLQPTKEQLLRTNVPNSPAIQKAWVQHIVAKYGTTAAGGVAVYELDNEPGGWSNTHRDLHPGPLGHDELVNKSIAYAAAVKEADPTALILGPGDFMNHFQNDGAPGDGSKEHDGLGQGNYFLTKMAAWEKQHGKRLLDYFDGHYYPTNQDGQNDAIRLESTRSLWDPTYKEKNWIGQWRGAICLIPNFHQWVDKYYPGTKIGISEYGWGNVNDLTGVLCATDVLGIFGREKLDLACMFGPPKAADPGANAFRVYRNFDGQGGSFGETGVSSVSDDQIKLAVYGAVRAKDNALTLVIINKTDGDLTSQVILTGFKPAGAAKMYRFSGADLKSIKPINDQPVAATGFTASFPAKSVTVVAAPGR